MASSMSNSLVILSLKEGKFFFDPVARLVDGKLERLAGLRRSLTQRENESGSFNQDVMFQERKKIAKRKE